MSMILDALKYLGELKAASIEPRRVLGSDDPRTARLVIGGALVDRDVPPSPRSHEAGTLAEVVALANRFAGEPAEATEGPPVVWYDAERVVLVIDDNGHRLERTALKLETSDVFATLMKLGETKPWMDHKPFVRMLRIDLAGALEPGILERARSLIFESDSKASSVVTREKESLGRSISASVRAANGELPEEVELNVPVYKTAGESRQRYLIRCAIDVDHDQCRLRLFPLPDEIERVRQLAVESIGERLGEGLGDGVNFYQGKP